MAPGIKITTSGFREMDQALGEFSKATARNILLRAATAALKPVEEAAKANVPVRVGDLRDSITTTTRLANKQANLRYSAAMFARQGRASAVQALRNERRASKGSSVEVYVGAGQLPHAHLIEFGTSRQSPQPYLRPAWDANRVRALELLKTELAREIDKAAARARRKALKAAGS